MKEYITRISYGPGIYKCNEQQAIHWYGFVMYSQVNYYVNEYVTVQDYSDYLSNCVFLYL